MRTLCGAVLASEALVIFFAVLVAKDLTDIDDTLLFAVGGGAAVACLVLAGLLRYRWAYVVGSVLQVFVIASGFVVPMMFGLGVIFAALWVLAIYLARRVARLQEAHAARAAQAAAGAPEGSDHAEGKVPGRDDTGRT